MITVDYSHKDFETMAHTLDPSDLGYDEKSGWTVEGEVEEDYYKWVNDFIATHPKYGRIEGNFESKVEAESQKSLDHFLRYFTPVVWDYHDI